MGMVEVTHNDLTSAPEGSMSYSLQVEGPPIQLLTLNILMDPVEASGHCMQPCTHDLQNQLVTLGRGLFLPETLSKTLLYFYYHFKFSAASMDHSHYP